MLLPIVWSRRDGLPDGELLSSDIATDYHYLYFNSSYRGIATQYLPTAQSGIVHRKKSLDRLLVCLKQRGIPP